MCDFEQALITAIQTELHNTRIEGCHFHFKIWRHVKEHGLTRAYRNHERVKKVIRKVVSIGLHMPTAIVRNNFALLRTENRIQQLLRDIQVWWSFSTTYTTTTSMETFL